MGKYMWALAVVMGSFAEAQRSGEVVVNVIVMEVDAESTNREPRIVTSVEATDLLNKLLNDTRTELISQSQLQVSNGMTSALKIAGKSSLANTACPASLNKLLATSGKVEITPHVYRSGENLRLNVALLYPTSLFECLTQPTASQDRSEFDLQLRNGEVVILGGLKPLSNENESTRLMIALTPGVILPDLAR